MKPFLIALLLTVAGPLVSAGTLDVPAWVILGKHSVEELGSASAKRSIRGTKALWTELRVQTASKTDAFESMKADLKTTELEGQLRSAGLRIMDPKRRSLALGLRPTLVLSVYYVPKGSEGNDSDFYLVTACATQDVTPLGGDKLSMTTWLKAGDVIASSGHVDEDIAAIRASAKACVMSFIDTAQDNDTTSAEPSKP
jgi:hypothetical protein